MSSDVHGVKIKTTKKILAPTEYAYFFIENFTSRLNEMNGRALDIGTGSGILAITLARRRYTHVEAIDINCEAINVAKENADLNGVSKEISFYHSDIFNYLDNRTKYDLVICNPPTFSSPNKRENLSPLELAFFSFDYGHSFIEMLYTKANDYLKHNGRLMTIVPSYHPMKYLFEILNESKLQPNIVASKNILVKDYIDKLISIGIDGHKLLFSAASYCQKHSYRGFNLSDSGEIYSFELNMVEVIKQ
jgi:HemK-like putative methylase